MQTATIITCTAYCYYQAKFFFEERSFAQHACIKDKWIVFRT